MTKLEKQDKVPLAVFNNITTPEPDENQRSVDRITYTESS